MLGDVLGDRVDAGTGVSLQGPYGGVSGAGQESHHRRRCLSIPAKATQGHQRAGLLGEPATVEYASPPVSPPSYRRAEEIFEESTRLLANPLARPEQWADPQVRTLHRWRHSSLTHDAENGTSTPMLLAAGCPGRTALTAQVDGVDLVAVGEQPHRDLVAPS
ncbi:hypothetical protein [Streptomyces sp. YGL11-2]|uniref:hypothetical protein n=1 Tax=Streptomyces sp. YGL11-2 TaxID=3414028 RepID=UPI003CF20616